MPETADLHDDIEAFVLGTLSQERRRAMTSRLQMSPELRGQIAEARAIVLLLAESPPLVEPSPTLRGRLLRAARADVVGYAFGALDHANRDAVAREIAASPTLQRDLIDANSVMQLLAGSAPAVAPPASLRDRLLAAVAVDQNPASQRVARSSQSQSVPLLTVVPGREIAAVPARRRVAPAWLYLVAAACFLLAVVMGAWNVVLQQQVREQAVALAADRAALQALPGADRFWTMRGEPTLAPEAVSTLALNKGQKQTVLIVRGFPPLADGQAYQVWVVQGGSQVPVGAFSPQSLGTENTLVVPSDLSGVTHAMITIEPAGGSPRPTGPTVMGGDL